MSRATSIDFSVTKTAHKAITVSWSYKDGATTYTSPSHLKSQTIIIDSQGPGVEGVVKAINLYDITARSYVITDTTPGVILSAPFSVKLVAGMDPAGAYTRNQLASTTLLSQQLVSLVPTPEMTISGTDKGIKFEVTSGATLPADVSYVEVALSSSSSDGLLTATVYKSSVAGNVFTVGFGGFGNGLELFNGAAYEVSVRYYTEVNGYGDWLSVESVVPSAVFSAPRNVTVVRPSGADADNGSLLISWQSPENDVNPNVGNTSTFVDHYEVWYKAAASAVSAPSSFDASGHPLASDDWVAISGGSSANGRIATTSSETQGAGSYSHKQTGLDAGKLYWFVIRAARAVEPGEVDNIAPTTDGELLGAFSAPVDGLVFNYDGVAAPTMTASTTINQQYLNYNIAYPANATAFSAGNVADLAAAQYSSRYVVKYAPVANGSSGSVEGGYTADATGAAVSANSSAYTSPAGPGMVISYGTTNYVYYVVFEQTYKGTVYTSADSGASSLINGAAYKMLTTYQTLPAPTSFSSTGLNTTTYEPLSVGKADGDGRLKASWTGVSAAGYDNSRFHAGIYYRISGAAVANPDLVDGSVSENVTGSNGTNALGVGVVTTNVLGLNNGTAYGLKIQSYFYNDEMGVWVYSAETALSNNASGVNGNVPFYYPDAVVANSAAPSVASNQVTFTWNQPAALNGVGTSSEVSVAYEYNFTKDSDAPSLNNVDSATSIAQAFTKGHGYHVAVKSAYKTLSSVYKTNIADADAYDIYYAEPSEPVITLEPHDTYLNSSYAQGPNNAVLVFQKYTTTLNGGVGVAAHDVSANSEVFSGLTNGTQYYVVATATYSYGGQMWTSVLASSAVDLTGVPFGSPIITSRSFTVGSKSFSFTVNPNGRRLREYLFVGIPQDTANNYDANIEVLNSNNWTSGNGADNATPFVVNSGTFNYTLKQVLVVVENDAGTASQFF